MALHDDYLWPTDFAMDPRNRTNTPSWVSGAPNAATSAPKHPIPMHPVMHNASQRAYPEHTRPNQYMDVQHQQPQQQQHYYDNGASKLPHPMPPRPQLPDHHQFEELARQPPQSALWHRARPSQLPGQTHHYQPPQPAASNTPHYAAAHNTFTSAYHPHMLPEAPMLHDVTPNGADPLTKGRTSVISSVSDDLNTVANLPLESDLPCTFPASTQLPSTVPFSTPLGYHATLKPERLYLPPTTNVETATSSSRHAVTCKAPGIISTGNTMKNKQRRRYAHPKSSRYCHLCARHERAVTMHPCGNLDLGICQKSVCEKCFEGYGLDLAAAKCPRIPGQGKWICPHCQSNCPPKAKCHAYDRQTERRRMKTRSKKLGLLNASNGLLSNPNPATMSGGLQHRDPNST